ncbi:HDIG domain-containing protein [Candidatus Woesearchaeota archaeon]|nr:HDIG domain-containing protein [Candidatus Woesearchaeota archaeon]
MERITEKKAIELLRKYAPTEEDFEAVLAHAKAVQKVALKICKKVKCDAELVKTACLLHDIGRFQSTNPLSHGIVGAKILLEERLPMHAFVAERHLGAGISKEDIKEQKLKLPLNDYMPKTTEEKIVAHADNLVFGTKIVTLKQAVARFNKELGKKIGRRVKELGKEIEKLKKK